MKILTSCIESKFHLFKMEIEYVFLNALKFIEAVLGITPKAFDSVYVISIPKHHGIYDFRTLLLASRKHRTANREKTNRTVPTRRGGRLFLCQELLRR